MVDGQNSEQGDPQSKLLEIIQQFEIPEQLVEVGGDLQDTVIIEIVHQGVRYCLVRGIDNSSNYHSRLSPREKEIVRLVARGMANKKIALLLEVSQWTVATHLRRIFMKLGVNTRAEMIARVIEAGLL